ncbi:MAG: long-chain acyl-CoA synthetase [Planctomycetota bacterium]|nr:MAG: long-chain acyl-CoA synthetase [Planctomycetota bacterium]
MTTRRHQLPSHPCKLLPSGVGLQRRVDVLAATLRAERSTPVAVLADNCPSLALLELATQRAGRPWLPLPGFFRDAQLRQLVERCAPGTLLSDDPARLAALLPHDSRPSQALLGMQRFESRQARQLPGVSVLTCTSGSTGEPSVVLHRAARLRRVARSLATVTHMTPRDRHLAVLPLAVLLESVGGLQRSLLAGARLIVPPLIEVGVQGSSAFDPAALDRAVRRHAATSVILMPAQLAAWTGWLAARKVPGPATLRFVGVGGAPGPASTLEHARELGLPVSEGYGLSEAGSVLCLDSERDGPAGSVGRPLPHVQLRLAADGELHARGALCLGYLDRSSPPRPDGWWPTGDLAERDAAGRYWIRGRKDLRFATAFGRNVSPEWLERRLLELPGVRQAVVFGDGLPGPVALLGPGARGWSDAERDALPRALARTNRTLPDYARLRAELCLPTALDATSGLWTATGRPRRAALWQHFGAQLSALAEHSAGALSPTAHLETPSP